MNKSFFEQRIIRKKTKIFRRASNKAHTMSSDSAKTKNRRKNNKEVTKSQLKILKKLPK
jgi:ribosomal protein L35